MSRTASWNDIPDDILNVPRRASSSLRSARSSQSPQPPSAPLNFRPGRAPPRLNQPRRKSTQVHRQPLAETYLPNTQMEPDGNPSWSSPYLLNSGVAPDVYPLKHVAERVGREVEEFAEKLDNWKSSAHVSGNRNAVLSLVNDYKRIANETVSKLRRKHAAAQTRMVRHAWKDRLEAYGFNHKHGAVEDDDMDEDNVDPRDRTTIQDLLRWQDELNTWTLFEALIEVHTSFPRQEEDVTQTSLPLTPGDDRFAADGQSWIDFINKNKNAREKLVVLKWLELISEETGNDLEIVEESLLQHGSALWSSGWLETREKLKAEKRIRMWDMPIDGPSTPDILSSDGSLLVPQLDSDAITRLERGIEPADQESEQSMWFMCWLMFRRGCSMDDINKWFTDCKQFDKAFAIGAHTRDEFGLLSSSVKARYTWRMACRVAAEQGRLNHYERAVVGLLSGDLDPVQKISQGWEDGVYAISNKALVTEYREYLLQQDPSLATPWSKSVYGADSALDADTSQTNFIASLEHEAATRLMPRQSPMKMVQASLISKTFGKLAFEQGVEVSRKTSGLGMAEIIPTQVARTFKLQNSEYILDNVDTLRVFTHLLIMQQQLGFEYSIEGGRAATDAIIAGYINFLLLSGKVDAIPLYCSLVSEDLGPAIMARVLSTITNSSQRATYTKLMAEMGVDVLETLIQQYELAMSSSPYAVQDEQTITRLVLMEATNDEQWPGYRIQPFAEVELRTDEETLIRAMEWFEYINGCWAQTFDALKHTALMFLFAGRVQAAVELLHRMPPVRVSRMKTEAILGQAVDIMEYEAKTEGEQILCAALRAQAQAYYDMDTLFTAIQAMWNWRETEELRLRQNLSREDIQKIKAQVREAIGAVNAAMNAVLQPDMLATPSIVGDTDEAELQQARREELDSLEKLRQAYLPEMILAYLSALYAAGEWHTREALLEALELAYIVANSAELTRCFESTGRMRELVEAFAQCSKKLLLVNERERRGKKGGHDKRLQGGRTFGIFENRMV